MVTTTSIIMIIIDLIIAVLIPVILAIVIKRKYHTSMKVFFIGCAVWFVFAMILEQLMHAAILLSPAGKTIQGNIWLYGLYGGLAAGVFEETGRFLSMKLLMKKNYDNSYNSLMYGAGHGGFEALYILGITMINNLTYAFLINTKQTELLLATVPAEQQETVRQTFQTLVETKPYTFLLGAFERFPAVLLHISLSVLVWIAVTKGKNALFPLAVFLHFFVDAATVIINGYGVPAVLLEVIVLVMAVLVALLSYTIWKQNGMPEAPAVGHEPVKENRTSGEDTELDKDLH